MSNDNDLQAKSMEFQQKMADAQKKLSLLQAEGTAGTENYAVKIYLNGRYEATKVTIDPELMKQSPEVLCDLLASAFTDASHKAEMMIQAEMMNVMKDIKMPGIAQ